jgi:hypothetical protein
MTDAQPGGSDVSERTKKNISPLVMAVKRFSLRLGMIPKIFKVLALAVFAIGLCIGVQIVRRNSSGLPNYWYGASQTSSSTMTGVNSFNAKPRLVQLVWDDIGEMAPLIPQYQELIGRYNPLPNIADNHKMNSASKMDKGKCHKMADWQAGHNPTCNIVHEASFAFLEPFAVTTSNTWVENIRLIAAGGYRHVWM